MRTYAHLRAFCVAASLKASRIHSAGNSCSASESSSAIPAPGIGPMVSSYRRKISPGCGGGSAVSARVGPTDNVASPALTRSKARRPSESFTKYATSPSDSVTSRNTAPTTKSPMTRRTMPSRSSSAVPSSVDTVSVPSSVASASSRAVTERIAPLRLRIRRSATRKSLISSGLVRRGSISAKNTSGTGVACVGVGNPAKSSISRMVSYPTGPSRRETSPRP